MIVLNLHIYAGWIFSRILFAKGRQHHRKIEYRYLLITLLFPTIGWWSQYHHHIIGKYFQVSDGTQHYTKCPIKKTGVLAPESYNWIQKTLCTCVQSIETYMLCIQIVNYIKPILCLGIVCCGRSLLVKGCHSRTHLRGLSRTCDMHDCEVYAVVCSDDRGHCGVLLDCWPLGLMRYDLLGTLLFYSFFHALVMQHWQI